MLRRVLVRQRPRRDAQVSGRQQPLLRPDLSQRAAEDDHPNHHDDDQRRNGVHRELGRADGRGSSDECHGESNAARRQERGANENVRRLLMERTLMSLKHFSPSRLEQAETQPVIKSAMAHSPSASLSSSTQLQNKPYVTKRISFNDGDGRPSSQKTTTSFTKAAPPPQPSYKVKETLNGKVTPPQDGSYLEPKEEEDDEDDEDDEESRWIQFHV